MTFTRDLISPWLCSTFPPSKDTEVGVLFFSVDFDPSVKVTDIVSCVKKKQQRTVLHTDTVLLSSVTATVEAGSIDGGSNVF